MGIYQSEEVNESYESDNRERQLPSSLPGQVGEFAMH
jgi:hypothetical protein